MIVSFGLSRLNQSNGIFQKKSPRKLEDSKSPDVLKFDNRVRLGNNIASDENDKSMNSSLGTLHTARRSAEKRTFWTCYNIDLNINSVTHKAVALKLLKLNRLWP